MTTAGPGVETKKTSRRHHHHHLTDIKEQAKKPGKEGHHHHEGYGQRQKATAVKVQPKQIKKLEANLSAPTLPEQTEPDLSKDLATRAATVVADLKEVKDKLEVPESVVEKISQDPHGDIVKKIFEHANQDTKIFTGIGQDVKHLEGALLPEHHGMILDEQTKLWRIRNTDEQIAFEKEQKAQEDKKGIRLG